MSLKKFDWCSWMIGVSLSLVAIVLVFLSVMPIQVFLSSGFVMSVFCFDVIAFYLVFLSCLLWVSLLFWVGSIGRFSYLMIGLSVMSSILCYCCIHALWFWIFYEMSIVPLLVLLVVESPYSERYIASWYLLGYVVLTSLPMLLCVYYLSEAAGSFNMLSWSTTGGFVWGFCSVVIAVLFITKIPLPPFHVWLPIVHAEASSPVSVCLSGYIMKLGVLGVCRFCSSVLPDWVFSPSYILFCLLGAVLFFFAASRELDGKRWLAFLSLSHILVASGCLCVGGWGLSGPCYLYCLGHGLSAGLTFLLLWLVYDVSSTRNLSLLKCGISSSVFFRFLCCSSLCTVCSLPPSVQFFCEVILMMEASMFSSLFIGLLYVFIFLGGLIPLFLVGSLLTRHCDIAWGSSVLLMKGLSLVFLLFWSFFFFLVC